MTIDRFTPIEQLPQLLRPSEFSAVTGCSKGLTYELVRRGQLAHVKLGRLLRIARDLIGEGPYDKALRARGSMPTEPVEYQGIPKPWDLALARRKQEGRS